MASLEDKILAGPTVGYCEDGPEDTRYANANNQAPAAGQDNDSDPDDDNRQQGDNNHQGIERFSFQQARARPWTGVAANTGPKGVINDFNRRNRTWSSSSSSSDDANVDWRPQARKNASDATRDQFGQLMRLTSREEFLLAVDQTRHTVIVLVINRNSQTCYEYIQCIERIATQFPSIKFVSIETDVAGLSHNFQANGVPAILVYTDGELAKTLLKLHDDVGDTPEVQELQDFLILNQVLRPSI